MAFAHLHCHTDRSLLDGVGKSTEYAELAAQAGQTALAITDHGNLYGAPEHRRACERFGLKPVYGCEFYANDQRHLSKELKGKYKGQGKADFDPTYTDAHIVLLAMDAAGWRNMLWLNHDAVRNGYYYQPRTTHDLICEHNEGLIATTACLGSVFSQYALRGDAGVKPLREMLGKFRDAFGDRFYHEVHVTELEQQKTANAVLLHECRRMGIRSFVACDVHYACGQDANRQDEMMAIARNQMLNDPELFKLSVRSLWFNGPKDIELAAIKYGHGFDPKRLKAWIHRTGEVADRCNVDIYGTGELRPPRYIPVEGGEPCADSFGALKDEAVAGLRKQLSRFHGLEKSVYVERLKHELRVIRDCQMADFYLVTMDIVRFCRDNGIMVWTRGSGCASLVAAVTGITPIDPIRFGLLFERFVDPSRPNAPDFDLDIDASRRGEVVEWLTMKYGGLHGERIARIVSLSTFGLKMALRDVCRVHGVDHTIGAALSYAADRLEPIHGMPISKVEKELSDVGVADRADTIDRAIDELKAVADTKAVEFMDAQPDIIQSALTMVGRVRGRTLHAAGYVVGPEALVNYIPVDRTVDRATGEPVIITAWGEGQASQDIAGTGLMKIDLLALETVAVVSKTAIAASKTHGRDVLAEIDGWAMDYEDPGTLREFATGIGFGLHQLNSGDQQLAAYVKKLRPKRVDDIIAALAIFRPGASDFLDEFAERSAGRGVPIPVHAIYDEETRETHGVIIYQEQIMRILHRLGGLPLRDAYKLIKAISKKDEKKIKDARVGFTTYAVQHHGMTEQDASSVFDLIEQFAGYGFNKAHAGSYGVLCWVTAYLRSRYPLEFWWAWLDSTPNESPNKKAKVQERRIELMMRQASAAGVNLYGPRIGHSGGRWRVIRTGNAEGVLAPLSLVNGVGDNAAQAVREAWLTHKWPDVWAFLAWAEVNKKLVNRKSLTSLAQAGAFSTFKIGPEQAVDIIGQFVTFKKSKKNGTQTEQTRNACGLNATEVFTTTQDGDTRMAMERQALGFSFWWNPWRINGRERIVRQLVAEGKIADENDIRLRGRRRAFQVTNIRRHKDKRGKEMGFISFRTLGGKAVRGVAFASVWGKAGRVRVDQVYLVAGEYGRDGEFIVGTVRGLKPFRSVDALAGKAVGA